MDSEQILYNAFQEEMFVFWIHLLVDVLRCCSFIEFIRLKSAVTTNQTYEGTCATWKSSSTTAVKHP